MTQHAVRTAAILTLVAVGVVALLLWRGDQGSSRAAGEPAATVAHEVVDVASEPPPTHVAPAIHRQAPFVATAPSRGPEHVVLPARPDWPTGGPPRTATPNPTPRITPDLPPTP